MQLYSAVDATLAKLGPRSATCQLKSQIRIRLAKTLRLKAERRLGKMLRVMPKATGAKGIGPIAVSSENRNQSQTLADIGIIKKTSMREMQERGPKRRIGDGKSVAGMLRSSVRIWEDICGKSSSGFSVFWPSA